MDKTCEYYESCGMEICNYDVECPEYKKKSKPILFNTPMVKAILEGRKTATRRIVDKDISNKFDVENDGKTVIVYIDQATGDRYKPTDVCRYKIGDILWVQETWKVIKLLENTQMQFEYRADGLISKSIDFLLDRFIKFKKFADKRGWQSPYFMPREAARIYLKVTDVRAERLQDITLKGIKSEGIEISKEHLPNIATAIAYFEFKELWNSTIKKQDLDKYDWDSNLWVWVIEFERQIVNELRKEENRFPA